MRFPSSFCRFCAPLMIFLVGLSLACSGGTKQDDAKNLRESLDALSKKVSALEENQKALLENQRRAEESLGRKIDEIKPGVIQLKKLGELEKERELIETPTEKVRRAMQEMRILATAVMNFATDFNKFPENPANHIEPTVKGRLGDIKFCAIADISKDLFPLYHKGILAWDPWGQPYLYWSSPDGNHFMIVCTGEDGHLNPNEALLASLIDATKVSFSPKLLELPCYETDIIWCDDTYLQRPQSPLHHCYGTHQE